ncbi:DUF192 domain-containing protein [Stutzerimonas azotifigens]|uniref:DUF192 domain-containing protein n=1 Tax=Stutzerimonas azotifigens TaxID=291995 RepID=A0ABR5Z6L1_9GAMM|nr:DUF192 domain-containing protein [Stutzerimonas azotifigens]MBA1275862.1 DUF192 domain-containing protein [Stutzerimonas azotifigens]
MRDWLRLSLLGLALVCAPSLQAASLLPLRIGEAVMQVEFADTEDQRRQGLMHRRELPLEQGMLFRFPALDTHCLWMKNTPLPLSAAFMDDQGRIVDILDLQPLTLDIRCARRPSRFALEANQGWFEQRGIAIGDRVEGLPPVR